MFDQTINGAFTLIPRTSITRQANGVSHQVYGSGVIFFTLLLTP